MNRKVNTAQSVPGYDISVTGRHIEITDAMRDYAIEKVSKIDRFTDRVIDVQVTMDIQKLDHRVDILLQVGHLIIKGSAMTDNMYASIDKATDRIQRQLRRYKERLQEHQARSLSMVDLNVNVLRPHFQDDIEFINDAIADENVRQLEEAYQPHEIVDKQVLSMPTLTYDEAIMRMELSGDGFLVFRSEEDQGLKVIHRLEDGNFGVIEPQ